MVLGTKHCASSSAAQTKQGAAGKVAGKRVLTKAKQCTAPSGIDAGKDLSCIGKKNDMLSGCGKVVAKGHVKLGIRRMRHAQPHRDRSVSTPSKQQQQQQPSPPPLVIPSAAVPSSGRKGMYTGMNAGLLKIRYKDGKDGINNDKQKLEDMEARIRGFFGDVAACIDEIDCIDLTLLGFQILGKGLQEFALGASCKDGENPSKKKRLSEASTSDSDPEDKEDGSSSSSSS